MTYNVLWGAGVDRVFDDRLTPEQRGWGNRLESFLDVVKKANPDVLAVQEAAGWDDGNPSIAQHVATQLGMHHYVAKSSLPLKVVLFSKLPITNAENLSPIIAANGAIKADLLLADGEPLHVIVVHLDALSSELRNCQAMTLLERYRALLSHRAVILGDFNFAYLSRTAMSFEREGWTLAAFGPAIGGIDQIWVSPGRKWTKGEWRQSLARSEAVPERISDHPPASVELQFYETSSTSALGKLEDEDARFNSLPKRLGEKFAPVSSTVNYFESNCSSIGWQSRWLTEKLVNGRLEIKGEEFWKSNVHRPFPISEGRGAVLYLRYDADSESNIYYDSGQWDTQNYRRFGLGSRNGSLRPETWEGRTFRANTRFQGSLELKPENWYGLLMFISADGRFYEYIWDATNPTAILEYQEQLGDSWRGRNWTLRMGANKGLLLLDDFVEVVQK